MFEKFGEMNSFEEINELADNLYNEGDIASLKLMAMENGIDEDMVQRYLNGELFLICDVMTAALGKLDIEEEELKPKEIMVDWLEYIRVQCMENTQLAFQVRKKGKSLKACIAKLLVWSFANQQDIDKDILKMVKITANKVTLGIPGMGQAKKIIKEYYLGDE